MCIYVYISCHLAIDRHITELKKKKWLMLFFQQP